MEQENEAQRQVALAHIRKLRDAYVAVFGELGKPTPLGELILDDLEVFTAHRIESLAISPQAGLVDIHATIYRTGKQAVMKRIYERIKWREHDVNPGQ